jgi:hypothetical protein
LSNSLTICARLHKVSYILVFKIHLPQIEELDQLKTDEESFSELRTKYEAKQMDARAATKVMVDLMNDLLVKPTRS